MILTKLCSYTIVGIGILELEVIAYMPEKQTNIKMAEREAEAWRALAAACGIFIPRGVGSGKWGNGAEAIRRVAQAYLRDPDTVLALLAPLLKEAKMEEAVREQDTDGASVTSPHV
jgi:hypothetical protein